MFYTTDKQRMLTHKADARKKAASIVEGQFYSVRSDNFWSCFLVLKKGTMGLSAKPTNFSWILWIPLHGILEFNYLPEIIIACEPIKPECPDNY